MITYHYGDTEQISPHFRALEFQCKCAGRHDFQLDENLVVMLEKLYDALDCSAINVSSGFRCLQHDKAVGGSGTGQHIHGKAADICCIGHDGQPIDSRLVCIAAQDVGLTGIARINATYTHVDVRSGKWYGDETKGNSYCIPCGGFREYFGIKKEVDPMKNGIDVSAHNGVIDWGKVKSSGIEFAILRAGYGKLASQKDTKFDANYAGATAAGVPVGVYWYSYAKTPDEARLEADVCISVIKGRKYSYPIYFDIEEDSALKTGKDNCSAMVRAFCERLESAGYWAGLYASRSVLQTYITDAVKNRFAVWAAEWGDKLNYTGPVGIWQKSESGRVNGISGNVDLDVCYVDYPEKIKARGLNGYAAEDHPDNVDESIPFEMTLNGQKYAGTLKKI